MNEDQYISRINQLEKEIGYLHSLLDEAGITYRKKQRILKIYLLTRTFYLTIIKVQESDLWK